MRLGFAYLPLALQHWLETSGLQVIRRKMDEHTQLLCVVSYPTHAQQ